MTRKVKLPKPTRRRTLCFRCDGTGNICDLCGESETACRCEAQGLGRPAFSDCGDCKGTGK